MNGDTERQIEALLFAAADRDAVAARIAAFCPALSPSKQSSGTGTIRHSMPSWFSVSAVPSGATASAIPASASAMTSI